VPADKCGTVSLPMLALISVRPPPSGYCAHHRRSPHQGRARCGACSPTLTVPVLVPLILLSRFFHLVTYYNSRRSRSVTPSPAIAYTSGKYSLPSAARVEAVRPSRELIQFSRCPGGVALAPFSSDLKVSGIGASCQAFQPVRRLAHSVRVRTT
jgi:hypothetical protein